MDTELSPFLSNAYIDGGNTFQAQHYCDSKHISVKCYLPHF